MGQELTEAVQKKIDETIIEVMNDYQDEFEEHHMNTSDTYRYTPFELFQLQKMAILKIGMDHMKVRIANEVKDLLNDFIEQVNTIAGVEPKK